MGEKFKTRKLTYSPSHKGYRLTIPKAIVEHSGIGTDVVVLAAEGRIVVMDAADAAAILSEPSD